MGEEVALMVGKDSGQGPRHSFSHVQGEAEEAAEPKSKAGDIPSTTPQTGAAEKTSQSPLWEVAAA